MRQDARGCPIDTDSDAAAVAFDTAIARFFEFRIDAPEHADAAIAADPDCALANLLKAFMLTGAQSRRLLPMIGEHIAVAEKKGASLAPRAKGWLAGLKALYVNDLPAASFAFNAHLAEWPLDLYVLKQMQQQTLFWRGRSLDLRDSMLRVRHAWDESVPGYAHYLGMLAFGYEEAGDYVAAERAGREAVDRSPDDIWGIHSVAHVLEMQGRHAEGIAWINHPADAWDDRAPLARHIWWHKSLFHWDSGDYDGALALFDQAIYPAATTAYIDMQNAVSLLWRLEMTGVDVGDRWEKVAGQAEATLDDQMLAFTDSHVSMALARSGRGEALARHRQILAERADGGGWSGALAAEATLPLTDSISDYFNGDFDKAVNGFLTCREEWSRVGGSHAQRDLYAQALLDAAVKAGRKPLAEALIAERATMHPTSQGVPYWRLQMAA
jgi:tetratricopeptide (TPR) repeat protein